VNLDGGMGWETEAAREEVFLGFGAAGLRLEFLVSSSPHLSGVKLQRLGNGIGEGAGLVGTVDGCAEGLEEG